MLLCICLAVCNGQVTVVGHCWVMLSPVSGAVLAEVTDTLVRMRLTNIWGCSAQCLSLAHAYLVVTDALHYHCLHTAGAPHHFLGPHLPVPLPVQCSGRLHPQLRSVSSCSSCSGVALNWQYPSKVTVTPKSPQVSLSSKCSFKHGAQT